MKTKDFVILTFQFLIGRVKMEITEKAEKHNALVSIPHR